MMYGIDALGLQQWDKAAVRALPKGFALGVFANTFEPVWRRLGRIAGSGKFPRIRVHAVWEDDNHKYQPRKHDPIIAAEFAKFRDLACKHPGIDWQFSPFCEVNGDLTEVLQELKKDWPRLVNSVWRGPLTKPALAINEVHGDHAAVKGTYNYSFDGTSCVDSNVTAYKKAHARAETFYLWHPSFNGRRNVDDKTPRPERKFWPTPELIQSVAYLANQRGRVNLPPNWLWKSHADVHNVPPEPRAYKPVLLAPEKLPEIILLAADGHPVARLPYFGPFADGRHRYYAEESGYKIAEKARLRAGTAVCRIRGIQGRINPAFREGAFR